MHTLIHADTHPYTHRLTLTPLHPFVFVSVLSFNHWFDGMALMHRFYIHDGEVTYSSRFLRSDSYVRNSEKDRIVVCEFGTMAMPDPCKNFFSRFLSRFKIPSKCL